MEARNCCKGMKGYSSEILFLTGAVKATASCPAPSQGSRAPEKLTALAAAHSSSERASQSGSRDVQRSTLVPVLRQQGQG